MKRLLVTLGVLALTPAVTYCAIPTVKQLSKHAAFAKLGGAEGLERFHESEKNYLALKKEFKSIDLTKHEKSLESSIRAFFALFNDLSTGKITETQAETAFKKIITELDQIVTTIAKVTKKQPADLAVLFIHPLDMIMVEAALGNEKNPQALASIGYSYQMLLGWFISTFEEQ